MKRPAWLNETEIALARKTFVPFEGTNVAYSVARDVAFHGRPVSDLALLVSRRLDAWLEAVCGDDAVCHMEGDVDWYVADFMSEWDYRRTYNTMCRLPMFTIARELSDITREVSRLETREDEVRIGTVLAALDVDAAKTATAVLRAFRSGTGREDIARGIARFVVVHPATLSPRRAQDAFDRWTWPQPANSGTTYVPKRAPAHVSDVYRARLAWIAAARRQRATVPDYNRDPQMRQYFPAPQHPNPMSHVMVGRIGMGM